MNGFRNNTHRSRARSSGPLLVKLGGAAIDQASEHTALFEAICDLHRAMRAQGDGVVLVHGGGAAVDRQLEILGMPTVRRDGIRITPPEQIDQIVGVLAGAVNKQLVGCIQRLGTPAVGLCLSDGMFANCAKAAGYDFDPGCVGEIHGGDPKLIHVLLESGFMPVLSSIGLDDEGQPLNINADDAAAGLASVLGCRGLILLTDVPGVYDAAGQIIDELDEEDIQQRIASGEIKGGMIPKVRGALKAANAAHSPVTIAAWNDPASLRRLAYGGTAGTRIRPTNQFVETHERDHIVETPIAATPWSDVL